MSGSVSGSYHCELAAIDGVVETSVAIEVVAGRFASITPGADPPDGAVRLAGLSIPGLANTHSHAFHRALRSRTQAEGGTFWTWREVMYRVLDRLGPEQVEAIAAMAYVEMVESGFTRVGEFHYLHHAPDGTPYADRAEMAARIAAAAQGSGIGLTLLPYAAAPIWRGVFANPQIGDDALINHTLALLKGGMEP